MFKKTRRLATNNLPTATIVKIDDYYYFIKGDFRLKFVSKTAVDSWNSRVVEGDSSLLDKYHPGGLIGFRDGTLLATGYGLPGMFLVSGGKLRRVPDNETLHALGLRESDVLWVSLEELIVHKEGEPIER